MAQYRVLHTSFINNTLVREGDIVEFEGDAGANLEPLKKEPAKNNTLVQEGAIVEFEGDAGANLEPLKKEPAKNNKAKTTNKTIGDGGDDLI